jgi:hypothetical protein
MYNPPCTQGRWAHPAAASGIAEGTTLLRPVRPIFFFRKHRPGNESAPLLFSTRAHHGTHGGRTVFFADI